MAFREIVSEMSKLLKIVFLTVALVCQAAAEPSWREHYRIDRPEGLDSYKSINDEEFCFSATKEFPEAPDLKVYIISCDATGKYAASFDEKEKFIDGICFIDNSFSFSAPYVALTDMDSTEFSKSVSSFPVKENNVILLYDRDMTLTLGITDPIEGFNRVMYAVNHGMMLYVIRPVNWAYASIFPRYMITGFKRMCDNLEFIVKGGSCLLQAKFNQAGIVGLRFLINITAGVVGFYDPAYDWFGYEDCNEDFGQAFASWGIGHGFYMVLPFMGPTSIRDAVGAIFDYGLDPKSYVYGGQWFAKLNWSALYIQEYINMNDSRRDPYIFVRDTWFIVRRINIKN